MSDSEETSSSAKAREGVDSHAADRAEGAGGLRLTEAALHAVIEHMNEGLVVADIEGNLLHWNRAGLEMHGFSSLDEVLRKLPEFDDIFELATLAGEVLPLAQWPMSRLLRGERVHDFEVHVRRKNTAEWARVFRYSGAITNAPDGKPLAFLSISDNTARVAARKALQESEERLRIANAVGGIGIYETDIEKQVLRVSPELAAWLGMTANVPIPIAEAVRVLNPQDFAVARERAVEARGPQGSGVTPFELRALCPDGTTRYLSGTSQTFFRESPSGRVPIRSIGACTDITERVRATQRLATQNAVSRVLAESASLSEATPKLMQALCETEGWDLGAVWEVDASRNVLRCAEMWHSPEVVVPELAARTRQLQLSRGEGLPGRVWALGTSVFIDDVMQDANDARAQLAFDAGLRRALAFPITLRGEVTGVIDFLGRAPRTADDPLREMFRTIGGQLGLFFERKRGEVERVKLEAQLRESQKMEAIGKLSGGIAHDLNNALAAILGNAHLALLDLEKDSGPAECVREIAKASERARDLVQQILTFARRRPIERKVVALKSIVDETIRLLRATLPAGVALAFTCTDESLQVIGDATQIHQVLVNLGTNAWQAMQGNPGRIEISLTSVPLDAALASELSGIRPGRYARIRVLDTGAGMSANTIARMFEPFFTTKPVGQGTGLGLSVVHGIVQEHQGAVHASSQLGHGATFEVYLPLARRDVALDAAGRSLKPPARANGERLLYIDDEDALVLLAKRYLGRIGYDVTGAEDGQQAIETFAQDPTRFDAVVTDMNMPGLSGLQVAEAILKIRPDVPAILSSGYVTEELRSAGTRLGLRAVVHKPMTIDELAEVLHEILARA